MIVKNESKLILRCLESVRPILDYVLIEDTGSTDGTPEIIREWLGRVGLPGEVSSEPWRDFAYNRSHALERLRKIDWVDYAFILDADDHIVFEADFDVAAFKNSLTHDVHDVELRDASVIYRRQQICSNRREFKYRGVLHEYLDGLPGMSVGGASGFHIASTREGARSQDSDKYRKDVQILENALQTETNEFLRSRYTFYLAQSYRDCGEREKALENYLKRATLGHWAEEVFYSIYQAAKLQEALKHPAEEVIASYLKAREAVPTRAEALHGASRFCRNEGRNEEGYRYAKRGLDIPLPCDGLFVESWVYEYGLLDELAVHAYWTGRYAECLAACERILREGKIPAQERDRIEQNARFAREKLSAPITPSIAPQTGVPVFIHSSPRTSSTWFWLKFRELPSTLCYYEPFSYTMGMLWPEHALTLGGHSWDSRHPPGDPWRREYIPLLRETGGIEQFGQAMTIQWFIPQGGLRGELRPSEKDYLSLLIRHAAEPGKVPVLGCIWSLGRMWAIKQAFGGFNIFLYRNLWQHWLSYLSYAQRGDMTFYVTVMDTIFRDDDPFFQYLVERGLKHAAENPERNGKNGERPLRWKRMYEGLPRDQEKADRLEFMPEHHTFALFMGLHIYLYLHAQLCADLTADGTRMARDEHYRSELEQAIKQKTGLAVSFADVTEIKRPNDIEFDRGSVDWDEIREHARTAVQMLSAFGGSEQLTARATEFIDAAFNEMQRDRAPGDERDKTFVTLYNAAKHLHAAGCPFDEVIAAYVRASNAAPGRAEALHAASRFCRENRKYAEGYEYGRRGLAIVPPAEGIAFEKWIYDYGLLDEHSVNAYWAEHYQDSFDACLRLLSEGKMPPDMHERVAKNTQFAAEKVRQLNARSRSVSTGAPSNNLQAALTQIHVINLERSSDRLAKFNRRNSHLANVLRYPAVDGALTDRQELIRNGIMLEDCFYSSGTLGCALSHIELWKKVQGEDRPITIFEDDVIAAFGFEEKVERLASSIPADWDIILWGHIFDPPKTWANVWADFGSYKANIHCFGPAEFDDPTGLRSIDYNHSLLPLLNAWGMVAYSVSPNGARILLNFCLPLRKRASQFSEPGISYWDQGIDGAINGVYP
ncbi:MAG: glycosyltransferase family 25 protein, partial [Candidatus Acidiferrales bacterium]